MEIFGLNVASSENDLNGRGWIDPITLEFVYLPIRAYINALFDCRTQTTTIVCSQSLKVA